MVGVAGNLFIELGIVVILAAAGAYLLKLLRQPQLLAYVLVGVLLTPVLRIVTDTSIIESMSIIGIAFLLFIVGLEMDLSSLKNVALVSSLGSVIQIVILFMFGYLASIVLGFMSLEAMYIGLMIAFSSTMVVLKLLSDTRELNTLHGRLAIGILLTQDIVAIFALSILTSINGFNATILGLALVKFAAMFAIAYLLSRFVFPTIFEFAAKNQELLLVSSLGVCFVFSLAFYYLGFSIAIGAFIAGIALGNLKYNYQIIAKVKSLKDFFALIFFVSLGMGISLSVFSDMWLELIILLAIVVFVKPFVIMTVCSLFKYTKKPSFLAANSLAQVGEFSLILLAQGLVLGHVSQELFSLTVIVTIISIVITSYTIEYDEQIYKFLQKPLKLFDIFTTEGLEYLPRKTKPSIILCGHNRIGYSILRDLHEVKKKVLVVDYNPEVIAEMVHKGFHCLYGEATDEEIIERMNLRHVKIFISTIPLLKDNLHILREIRKVNKRANVMIVARQVEDALKLYEHGANYVILPHFLGGDHVSHILTKMRKKKIDIIKEKDKHIKHLEERKGMGHELPSAHH